MGVRVGYATAPLTDDVRSKLRLLGPMPEMKVSPAPYNARPLADAAAFDSVPGIGFDSNPSAAAIVPPTGRVTGSGAALAIDPAQNNAYRAINRAWRAGASVEYVAGSAGVGARLLIKGMPDAVQQEMVASLALVAERTAASGTPLKRPRIGLFQPWSGSMDEGWTRWVLEQYGFDIVTIHPEDFKTPLGSKVDVLILADDARLPMEGGGAGRGAAGGGGRGGGRGAVRPEYAYAITAADLQLVDAFVREGGTIVCFNSAWRWAVQQFKLPVKNAADGLKPEDFFLRGSIVEVITDPTRRLMAGMPERAAVFVDGSPVFEPLEGFKGTVLAKYADAGSPLLSGYLIGEKYLQSKAAALDVEVDQGHIVLVGFRPQWRGQPFGTFRVVFNAALYGAQ
jgi:hypothetical protein